MQNHVFFKSKTIYKTADLRHIMCKVVTAYFLSIYNEIVAKVTKTTISVLIKVIIKSNLHIFLDNSSFIVVTAPWALPLLAANYLEEQCITLHLRYTQYLLM